MDRLTRIAGSFAIVMVAYLLYALSVARWIEPPIDTAAGAITNQQRAGLADTGDELRRIRSLFTPQEWAAWGFKEPMVFESDRARLVCEKYDNTRPDQAVKIWPCLIVFLYDGPAESDEEVLRQSIILEAPDGAVLKFDQPLSLTDFKITRLEHGWLNGEVRIRSGWKNPGPEDDLLIVTRDIELTEKTISTPQTVTFQWGPHYGSGRDMLIQLLTGPPKSGGQPSGPKEIESFELRHIDQLHLDLGPAVSSFGKPGEKAAVGTSSQTTLAGPPGEGSASVTAILPPQSVPVDINCQGAFRFDVQDRVASFNKGVDVRKRNPSGPSDQINCDRLSIYFMGRGEKAAEGGTRPVNRGSLDLVPERIEAQGNPVVATAPSQADKGGAVVAQGPRMQYNLLTNTIALDGAPDVCLRQGANEIHSPALCYKSAGPGRIGALAAAGPGWLRGESPDRPGQQLEARWVKQLQMQPADEKPLIELQLTGGAELSYPGVGQLQATDLYFWFKEPPAESASGQSRPKPYRMFARNNVHMNSERFTCKRLEEATVWFKEPAANVPPAAAPPTAAASVPAQQTNETASPLPSRFELSGRRLLAEVLLRETQSALAKLTIEGDVCLEEAQMPPVTEPPLKLRGHLLEAADLSDRSGTVVVTGQAGQPAHLEGRGMTLTGMQVHLDRGGNRLWIDGPGEMELPVPKDLEAKGVSGPLCVTWRREMTFDGRTATFSDSVRANTRLQQLLTQTMQVQLQRPVSFSEATMGDRPQMENISCQGGVTIESRSFNDVKQLVRHDLVNVSDFAVNVLSGALAAGAGSINSVGLGSNNGLNGFGANPLAAAGTTAANTSGSNTLNCLHIDFKKSATGNVLSRSLTFSDRVEATYGPVDSFDTVLTTRDPDQVGDRGMVASCDELTVSQPLFSYSKRDSIELMAVGNAKVEGRQYTATSERITYDQSKELLILQGTPRSNAVLYRQLEPGAEREQFAFKTLKYWLRTGKVESSDPRSLQLSQPFIDGRTR